MTRETNTPAGTKNGARPVPSVARALLSLSQAIRSHRTIVRTVLSRLQVVRSMLVNPALLATCSYKTFAARTEA